MNRNITAVYRTHAVADLVRRELEADGVSRSHIHVIPDQDSPVGAADADHHRYDDQIHDLYWPTPMRGPIRPASDKTIM